MQATVKYLPCLGSQAAITTRSKRGKDKEDGSEEFDDKRDGMGGDGM
jgi:hypothetical protein